MNSKNTWYWITTAVLAFVLLSGGIAQLARLAPNARGMAALGYPPYVMTILGLWKIAGTLAILAPRLPRLKEWAYAGAFFDLTGAAASHAASGESAARIIIPAAFALLVLASWALRPASRRLPDADEVTVLSAQRV